jgi:acetyl esterase
MMKFADGMEAVHRIEETFASEAEATAYWAEAAPRVPFEDKVYPGADGQSQRARLYRGDPGAPVLLYIHGGGWCGGSIALNDPVCRGITAETGWNVVSISYRLAPVHPYPAGQNDCLAAWNWLAAELGRLGLRHAPIALGGASAGANLALATCLAGSEGTASALVLFYGVFGSDLNTDSYHTYQNGPGLTRARMAELFEMYDPGQLRETDPLIAPLLSDDLSALPPTCLIAAEHDVLLDDSRQLAARLYGAGTSHEFHIETGVTHGFINRGRLVPAARHAISRAANFLSTLELKVAS